MNRAVRKANRKVIEKMGDAYNWVIDSACDGYYALSDRYRDMKERRRAKKYVRGIERKIGRVPTFGDILVEESAKQAAASPILAPIQKPEISEEERLRLNEELFRALGSHMPYDHIVSILERGAEGGGLVDGRTMLMRALYKYHGRAYELYDLLVRDGADLNYVDESTGMTHLMWAASACHEDACKWLYQKQKEDLDINAVNKEGKTALDEAHEMKGYNEDAVLVYDYLVSLGAKHASLEDRIKCLDEQISSLESSLEKKMGNEPDSFSTNWEKQQLESLKEKRSKLTDPN